MLHEGARPWNVQRGTCNGCSHGRPQQVEANQAQEGRHRRAARGAFHQADPGNHHRGEAGLRHVFQRYGGNLGAAHSVAWMFDRKAQIALDATKLDEDAVLEAALEAGAEDVVRDADTFVITGPVQQLHAITEQLKTKRIPVQSAEITMMPKSTVKVDGKDAKRLLELIDALEAMDDVAKVSSNFDMDADALAAATA